MMEIERVTLHDVVYRLVRDHEILRIEADTVCGMTMHRDNENSKNNFAVLDEWLCLQQMAKV